MPTPDNKNPLAPVIAVVGMSGFVGNHVARAARMRRHTVVGLRRRTGGVDPSEQQEWPGPELDDVQEGDARSPKTIASLIEKTGPQILVVTAGVLRRSGDGWVGGYSANYEIAAATVEAVTSLAPDHRPFVVWVGSQAEYGIATSPWTETTRESPVTAYGTSKLLASSLVLGAIRAEAMNGCVVRAPIIFGPGQPPSMFVSETICAALDDRSLPMTAGEQVRRLAYAPDLAANLIDVGARGRVGSFPNLLNAPGYPPVTIRRIADLIGSLLPDRPAPDIGAIPYRAHEAMDAWPATDLATSLDLTVKTPLENALMDTVDWYRSNEWFWRGSTHE